MIIGDKNTFALESSILKAYQEPWLRAWGYFVIYINGVCYGVREPEATLLACPYEETLERLAKRGTYVAPFAIEPEAGKLVDGIREAIYDSDLPRRATFFGMSLAEFDAAYNQANFDWSAACDEAFNDGSTIYHFEVQGRVRLIGCRFKAFPGYCRHDPSTLRDVWLEAGHFYSTLQQWCDAFELEWKNAPKGKPNTSGLEGVLPKSDW